MKIKPTDLEPEALDQILMWGPDFDIEIDGVPLPQEQKLAFYDECCKIAPQDVFIKLDDWHLLRDQYVIFGDLEDIDALRDNFEFFNVTPLWLVRIDRESFSLEGHDPLGLIFMRVPKWRREEAKKAFANYANRMEWKHKGYKKLAIGVMAEIRCVSREI